MAIKDRGAKTRAAARHRTKRGTPAASEWALIAARMGSLLREVVARPSFLRVPVTTPDEDERLRGERFVASARIVVGEYEALVKRLAAKR